MGDDGCLGWIIALGWECHCDTPNWTCLQQAVKHKREGQLDFLGAELDTIESFSCGAVDTFAFEGWGRPTLRRSLKAALKYAREVGCTKIIFYCHPILEGRTRLVLSQTETSIGWEVLSIPARLYPSASQFWVRFRLFCILRERFILVLEKVGFKLGE